MVSSGTIHPLREVRARRTTFREATLHLKGLVAGLPRTTGVVEWVWRRDQRRMRRVQCFMSEAEAAVPVSGARSAGDCRGSSGNRRRRSAAGGQLAGCAGDLARMEGEVGRRSLLRRIAVLRRRSQQPSTQQHTLDQFGHTVCNRLHPRAMVTGRRNLAIMRRSPFIEAYNEALGREHQRGTG